MQQDTKQWWKGNFPTWIAVAVISFIGTRLITEHDGMIQTVAMSRERIVLLESTTKWQQHSLDELKLTNDRIVVELRELRAALMGGR